jgi:glycosyltransferase involved in cell wall biosynthesis
MRDSLARQGGEDRRRVLLVAARRVARQAQAVVCVSPGEAERESRYLGRATVSIPSGFDDDEWQQIRGRGIRERSEVFSILFAGRYYREMHDLERFVQGLTLFMERRPAVRSRCRLAYLGPSSQEFLAALSRAGFEDIATDGGFLSPAEARRHMTAASLLLYPGPSSEGSQGWTQGKLFDYLASGTEILHVADDDDYVAGLLRTYRAGHTATTPDEVATVLADSFAVWERTGVPRPGVADLATLEPLSWRSRAGELAALLSELTGPR